MMIKTLLKIKEFFFLQKQSYKCLVFINFILFCFLGVEVREVFGCDLISFEIFTGSVVRTGGNTVHIRTGEQFDR
jgi:hypothetical protein